MNKKILTLVLASSLANVYATKMHDNEVNFEYHPGSGVSSVEFEYLDAEVSKGQPHDDKLRVNEINKVPKYKYEKRTLSFRSGRKNTSQIANYFTQSAGGNSHIISGYEGEDPSPNKLHFAIRAYMIINGSYVTDPVYIAQGHTVAGFSGNNNWWFGTNAAFAHDHKKGLCITTLDNKQYQISHSGDQSFEVSPNCSL